ncbi:hypothetical protein L3Q82_004267 [Scortum barcoo]|uniref:Uncharacterized protein n=1 Tax=Scortum barcoo TaxID=214431 RepID=A0ACB8VJV1_9TELE|nr:hypothetical protein L3Q82_004267 [Scortum barcoo]
MTLKLDCPRSSERRFHGVIILLLGLLSVFLLAGLIGLAVHYRTCPAGWRMFDSTCYFFSTTSASWEQSRRDCRDKGADLVVIESYEEQELLTKIIKKFTWIGLNDREKEGDWKWIDETPLAQAHLLLLHPLGPGPGRGGSSLSRDAQTSLTPDTSSSSSGGTPEAFPGQPRDIVSPACPGSSLEASSRWDMPGTPP